MIKSENGFVRVGDQYNGRQKLNRKNGVDKWTQEILRRSRKGVHDDTEETKDV